MSWFKVDDKLWGHPKWLATPIRSRGLWVTAGSWCADQEMDGNVPRHVLAILGATTRDAAGLVASGLWMATDTGWSFHGWAEFQPTRAQKEAEREEAKERMRLLRARRTEKRDAAVRENSDEHGAKFGAGSEDVRSTPTRPVPTRPDRETSSLSSEVAEATPRHDVESILDHLDTRLRANGVKVPARTKKNVDAARLLLDRDGRSVENVKRAIDYATTDDFWRAVILSMAKLREKYDQLRLSAERAPRTTGARRTTDDTVARGLSLVEQARAAEAAHDGDHHNPQIGA